MKQKLWIALLTGMCSVLFAGSNAAFPFSAQASGDASQSAHEQPVTFDFGTLTGQARKTWTIMVYMDGDNNLEPFALKDLNEMEKGLGESVNILVLIDRADGYDRSEGDWKDARVYRLRQDDDLHAIHSEIIAKPGELNMGEGKVLESFVAASIRSFPADHYALIMWDHGGGWITHALDDKAPGTPRGSDYLTLPELSTAIRRSLSAAGVKRLDMIGFDMCLMAELETAAQIADLAEVMVASQALEPDDGWPYDTVIPEFSIRGKTIRDIAPAIVEAYHRYYQEHGIAATTLSAYDLRYADAVRQALDRVLQKLTADTQQHGALLTRALFYAEAYQDRMDELPKGDSAVSSVDMMDTLNRIRANSASFKAKNAYRQLQSAMERFVLASQTGAAYRRSRGVSIYAPVSARHFNARYTQTRFGAASQWNSLLHRLYRYQRQQPKPAITDLHLVDVRGGKVHSATAAKSFSTNAFQYTVEGKNLLWVDAFNGRVSQDGKQYYIFDQSTIVDTTSKKSSWRTIGNEPYPLPHYTDGVNRDLVQYNGFHYVVSNGTHRAIGTTRIRFDSPYITVPILYEHPDTGKQRGAIYFDDQTLAAERVELYIPQPNSSLFVPRLITPKPDAKITPLIETITTGQDKTDYAPSQTLQWHQGLYLTLALASPGRQFVGMEARTIGMQSDRRLYPFDLQKNDELETYLKNASSVTFDDMAGTWDFIDYAATQKTGRFVPTGKSMILKPLKSPGAYVVKTTEASAGHAAPRTKIHYDTVAFEIELLPIMRTFSSEREPGNKTRARYVSTYLVTMMADPGTPKILFMKNLAGGRVTVAVKRSPDTTPQSSPAQPSPMPSSSTHSPAPMMPAKTNGLEGIWSLNRNEQLLIIGGAYRLIEYGMVADSGTCTVSGDTIIARSALSGVRNRLTYTLRGDRLTLRDAQGKIYRYTRQK